MHHLLDISTAYDGLKVNFHIKYLLTILLQFLNLKSSYFKRYFDLIFQYRNRHFRSVQVVNNNIINMNIINMKCLSKIYIKQ